MTAAMGHGISLYPAPDLQHQHGSLWAERRSLIVVGLFAPGGLSGRFEVEEESGSKRTRFFG